MPKITFNLNCDLEERLRHYTGRKGSLSTILNQAVELWLTQEKPIQSISSTDIIKSTEDVQA